MHNFLHSLFNKCSLTLNGASITQKMDLYQYRSYLETLLTYGIDAATSHLTNAFWYLDKSYLLPRDSIKPESKNKGFIDRWIRIKPSKDVRLLSRLQSDICYVIPYLLPRFKLQIKLTKDKRTYYLMNTNTDSPSRYQFLEVYLLVNRVLRNPAYLISHNTTLARGVLSIHNLTGVELKIFTFFSGPKSLSIDNAVLEQMPKHLLFAKLKNKDFLGALGTKLYFFIILISITSHCSITVNRFIARVCQWTWVMRRPRSWFIRLCLRDPACAPRKRDSN